MSKKRTVNRAREPSEKRSLVWLTDSEGFKSLECKGYTSLSHNPEIMTAVDELFDRVVDRDLLIRRLNISANRIIDEETASRQREHENIQLDLFTDYDEIMRREAREKAEKEREKRMQKALLDIKKKYGKNAVLKGMNMREGATAKERNEQIGGHKA